MSQAPSTIRCAVYTRKSSEEGLEQSFNSLHAQREACEAYVLSQRHEGWQLLPTQYDDGGFSGGNMERPGLKKLLDDIASKKIDNQLNALFATIPGNHVHNLRKLHLLNSNYADLSFLFTIHPGEQTNAHLAGL